jgi:hypothetical protein
MTLAATDIMLLQHVTVSSFCTAEIFPFPATSGRCKQLQIDYSRTYCHSCVLQYAVLGLSQMEAHKYRHLNE